VKIGVPLVPPIHYALADADPGNANAIEPIAIQDNGAAQDPVERRGNRMGSAEQLGRP